MANAESPTLDRRQSQDEEISPELDMYRTRPADNSVGWLRKRTAEYTDREAEKNYIYDWQDRKQRDLGTATICWAASFVMADHKTPNEWTKLSEIDSSTKIPLQAWQMAHELWEHGFHVQFTFSMSGFYIHLLIGLPYQTLLTEAETSKMDFRLTHTKGSQEFRRELIPRFPTALSDDNTCFSTAHKQGLTLLRMKRLPVILPQVALRLKNKEAYHKQIKRYHRTGKPIRSFLLQRYLKAMGVYRPAGVRLFGTVVRRVATEVLENPWLVIRPKDKDDHGVVDLLKAAKGEKASHADVGEVVSIFDRWLETERGESERFEGCAPSSILPLFCISSLLTRGADCCPLDNSQRSLRCTTRTRSNN
jgi:hypothetical protein